MLQQIEQILLEAGEMMRGGRRDGVRGEEKPGIGNYVSECDLAIQALLRERLCALFPGAAFVGEEGEAAGDGASMRRRIIVDPIDGTANFLRGADYSAISVGVVEGDRPRYGAVYNPFTGELFSAEAGKGARRNGQVLRVARRDLSHSIVIFGATIYSRELSDRMFRLLRAIFDRVEDIRSFGSAALDICHVASGEFDAFVELRLRPWDYAGAMCVLQEAGGIVTTADGGSLPFVGAASVLAAQPDAYPELLRICRSENSAI